MRKHIPIISACILGAAAFIVVTLIIFQPSVVPPRSTASIGFIFILPLATLGGLIGFVIGKGIERFGSQRVQLILLVTITVLTTYSSFYIVNNAWNNPDRIERELANTIGIKINADEVEKIIRIGESDLIAHGSLLKCGSLYTDVRYGSGTNSHFGQTNFTWSGDNIELLADAGGYEINNLDTQQTINRELKNYDYITSISVSPYEEANKSYLFVLANIRATSRRTLFTIYEKLSSSETAGEITYEELLERPGLDLVFGRGQLANGQKIATILSYSINEAPSPSYFLCDLGSEDISARLLYGYYIAP